MYDENTVNKKSWEEFRNTGLVLITNQILHIFGWALVFEIGDDDGEIKKVYPARVKFRGFTEKDVEKAYRKVTEYMMNSAKVLHEETEEE